MRGKSLLILASLVLALAGYLIFVERQVASTDDRRDAAKRVLDIEPASVREVRIEHAGETVQLIRQVAPEKTGDERIGTDHASSWRLVTPFAAPADRVQVDSLLRELAGLERQRTIEGLDRQAAGLVPPRATVTVTSNRGSGDNSSTVMLEIGPAVPATDSILVARTGHDSIEQVPATLWDSLTKAPGDWRDRTVLEIARENVLGARLHGPHGEIAIGWRDAALWVEAPFEDRADPSLTGKLLGAIALITVERYVDNRQEAGAADGSTGRIEVRLRDQPEATVISIGQVTPEDPAIVFARVAGQVVTMRSPLVALLATESQAWHDPRWATLQVFAIHRAILADAEGAVEIVRQDAEWRRDGEPVDYATASELLYAITDLESRVVAGERAETDLPSPDEGGAAVLTIRLESETGSDTLSHENLSLHPLADGRLAARSNRRNAVLLFAADAMQTLRERLAALRAAPLVTEEPK